MRDRVQFVLSIIEEAGKEGIGESELLSQMFLNGIGEPRLIKKYLAYLVGWEKIREKGGRFYSSNYSSIELQGIPARPTDSVMYTHTHIEGGQA